MAKSERAISPVVAVILLIAMTVVAASAVALYLSKSTEMREAPSVKLGVSLHDNVGLPGHDNDYFKLEHLGGDPLRMDELAIWILRIKPKGDGKLPSSEEASLMAGATTTEILRVGETAIIGDDRSDGENIDFWDWPEKALFRVWIVHKPSKKPIFDSLVEPAENVP